MNRILKQDGSMYVPLLRYHIFKVSAGVSQTSNQSSGLFSRRMSVPWKAKQSGIA